MIPEPPPSPTSNLTSKAHPHSSVPLHILAWDLFEDPEDIRFWSGISASVIGGLRQAGQNVSIARRTLPGLKRVVSSVFWHFHHRVTKRHYVPDRHQTVTRLFSVYGNWKLRNALASVDAVLTTSTVATAYLRTDKPIFIIHDATWAQVLELYPYFHLSVQLPLTVRDGFLMERATFTRPNVTLVLSSEWAARRAIADYQLPPERVHVLPLAANLPEEPTREEVEEAISARNGEHCNLLFVGKEFDRKGGAIAVETAEALRAMGVPTTLHVVGCRPPGLPPWVEVHGMLRKDQPEQLKTLLQLFAKSDFFLLPTRAEAQGIVFNEAAAFGLPVAATNVGGVSTVVPNGGWGLLLPLEARGAQYASWLAEIFRDRERYRTLARSAREDYEERLSRPVYTRELLRIMRETIQTRKTSPPQQV